MSPGPPVRPGVPGGAAARRSPVSSCGAEEGEHRGVDELFDWLPEDDVEGSDADPPSSSQGSARPGGPAGEKLQKVLARSGLASRRVCEELIDGGRVTVNGELARQGMRVDAERDVVEVDGAPVGVAPGLVYYLLNKPAGVVSTAHDPQQRRTVVQMVPDHQRVFPVGRLDTDTEGLLLLTNDGPLTQRLTHPSFGVEKEYLAEVSGEPSPGALRLLRDGVELEDGITAAARVALVNPTTVRLTIHEGRNRQVRRMLEAVGHPVVRLVRTRIGPITDRHLRPGAWRELSGDEVRALATAATPSTRAAKRLQRFGVGDTPPESTN